MKAKEKEIIAYKQVWESFDGLEFENSEECAKYENSAAGMLLNKIQDCIKDNNVEFVFDDNDENTYKLIIPKKMEDIDALNQLNYMYGQKTPFDREDIGKPVMLGIRYYCNKIDWLWLYNMSDIIYEITKGDFDIKPVK